MEHPVESYGNLADSTYWKNRRTVRKFTGRDVPDSLLFDLIDKAAKAPTTGGMQLYSVVVTREREILDRILPAHFNQPAATGAKVLLTIVADFNRFEKWCLQRGAEPGFDNFQSFVAAMLDATIFSQQLNTLLETEGLGVCYLGTTTYNAPAIGEALKLPRLTVPVVTLAVGWPDGEAPDAERLPAGALIHDEVYHDYTSERIEEIFAEKESLDVNRKFVAENNLPTLAHVFTDVRYPASNAQHFSEVFIDYIEQQGFKFPQK